MNIKHLKTSMPTELHNALTPTKNLNFNRACEWDPSNCMQGYMCGKGTGVVYSVPVAPVTASAWESREGKPLAQNLIDPRMRVVGTRNGLLSRFSWLENSFYLPGVKVEFLLISRAEFSFAFRPVFVDDIITLMFSLLCLLPIALLQFFFIIYPVFTHQGLGLLKQISSIVTHFTLSVHNQYLLYSSRAFAACCKWFQVVSFLFTQTPCQICFGVVSISILNVWPMFFVWSI